jgi:uncharacterized protein YqgC (DUF456 family)
MSRHEPLWGRNCTFPSSEIPVAGRKNRQFLPSSGLKRAFHMDITLYVTGAILILFGLGGAIVPALPGIPLIFGGIWLIAAADRYRHVGMWWLIAIACVGAVGLTLDLVAGALGAKSAGASPRAVLGAFLGTLVGLFFGLPGLLLGPFLGAVLGEFSAGNSVLRSTHVGLSAWVGLIFGTIIKMISSLIMVALFAAGWWSNRGL